MQRVRLIDVAERAGVSMKTVSNVVRGYVHVRPEMRARVQAAIEELGYRPNVTARRLVSGRTGMLALALPEMDQPYFAELARHVASLAPEFGYRVLIEQTLLDADAERAVLHDRDNGVVDGVLFHPARMPNSEIAALRSRYPLVLFAEDPPATADSVMMDNAVAAQQAIAYLVTAGRRRISYLGTADDDGSQASTPRLAGYHLGLDSAGVAAADRAVIACTDYSAEATHAALASALSGGLQTDAILCREDRCAIGALRALTEAGLSVPADVALISWDDTHLAQWSTPQLSSIRPDKAEMARTALRMVHDRIEGYQGPGRHVVVDHELIVRDST
ncbi:MAG: LacI family DNA-binding transcriptional regulator [Beutenbergiaceae bacterium]